MRKRFNTMLLGAAVALLALSGPLVARATSDSSLLVTNGSPTFPLSQNKQNEPAMAVDANNTSVVVAGSNKEIDEQACSSQFPANQCPLTPGVGVSAFYFFFDRVRCWPQTSYTVYTAPGMSAN